MTLEQVIRINLELAKNALDNQKPASALNHLYHIVRYALLEDRKVPAEIWFLRMQAYRIGEKKASTTAQISQEKGDYQTEFVCTHLTKMFRELAEIELYVDEEFFSIKDIEHKLSVAKAAAEAVGHDFSFFMEGLRDKFHYLNHPFPYQDFE